MTSDPRSPSPTATATDPPRRIGGIAVRDARGAAGGRWFFLAMAVAAALAVLAGFFPTYFRPLAAGELRVPRLVHVHGVLFLAWTALFVVQPALVRLRRVDAHRALGRAGAVLAAAMVVTGVAVALGAARRDVAAGDAGAHAFLLITLTDMLLFAALVGAALAYRARSQTHRRLMLLATAALLPAAFGRLFGIWLGIDHPVAMHLGADAFLAAGVAHDAWTRGRVHAAYLSGGALLVGVHALRLLLAGSAAWGAVAEQIVSAL